jgi:hypothetical protein
MRIFAVNYLFPETLCVLPELFARVRAFCNEYEHFGDPEVLVRTLGMQTFFDSPDLVALVMVDDLWNVKGHCILSLDQYLGKKYITLQQYQLDEPLTREQWKEQMTMIENWARSKGATEVRALVEGEVRERAYRAFYGFKKIRTLMVRPIEEV